MSARYGSVQKLSFTGSKNVWISADVEDNSLEYGSGKRRPVLSDIWEVAGRVT